MPLTADYETQARAALVGIAGVFSVSAALLGLSYCWLNASWDEVSDDELGKSGPIDSVLFLIRGWLTPVLVG